MSRGGAGSWSVRVLLTALGLLLAACGGGKSKDVLDTATTPLASSSTTGSTATSITSATSSPSTPLTTYGTVGTAATLSPAETALDKDYVPEAGMSFSFGRQTINGVSYSNALVMNPSRSSTTQLQINLGRRQHKFLGDLGIPDDQHSTDAYKVEISLDGSAPVLSVDVHFGETKKIDLTVDNILRIKISVTTVSSGYDNELAIGSPRVS